MLFFATMTITQHTSMQTAAHLAYALDYMLMSGVTDVDAQVLGSLPIYAYYAIARCDCLAVFESIVF